VVALLCLAAMPAVATEPAVAPPAGDPAAAEPAANPPHATRPASTDAVAGIGAPVDLARLEGMRGGDGTSNEIQVDGEVGGNHAENITSGTNRVDGGSFGNAAGVSTVIQNSGSNVLIQNAMIVNVKFADPTP
jgi:hypothetical protein